MTLVKSEILNIENRIWNSVEKENGIGLLSGLSGIALFYSNLYEVYKEEKYSTRLSEVIARIDELVSENDSLPTFCSGLAGYGWMLLNLKTTTIDISKAYFKTLDIILEEALFSFADKNDYDFLHGATGVAMYFMERLKVDQNNEEIRTILTLFSRDLLYKLNTNFDTVIIVKGSETKKDIICFGLAHGIASFINFLFYLSQYFKSLESEIKQALRKLISFLNSKKSFNKVSQQYYPSYIDNQENVGHARLGWCQGDLGIGLALYNAGTLLNNNAIKQEALDVITATEKISLETSGVRDCSLCHGSTGLIIQYYLAQKKCSIDTKEIQNRWYQELENQTCNFTTVKAYLNPGFSEHSNILVGAAGLGLTLLTLDEKIKNDWLRCLNLY